MRLNGLLLAAGELARAVADGVGGRAPVLLPRGPRYPSPQECSSRHLPGPQYVGQLAIQQMLLFNPLFFPLVKCLLP